MKEFVIAYKSNVKHIYVILLLNNTVNIVITIQYCYSIIIYKYIYFFRQNNNYKKNKLRFIISIYSFILVFILVFILSFYYIRM